MTSKYLKVLGLGAFLIVADAFAMVAEPTRVVLYRRGEAIAGEEFLTATEAIVDYLATLRRPTDATKGIRYNCMAKVRRIRPSVQSIPSPNPYASVEVRMVYELRNCAEIP